MSAYAFERDEWRAACEADWRSELPARPANDPCDPPYELRGVFDE